MPEPIPGRRTVRRLRAIGTLGVALLIVSACGIAPASPGAPTPGGPTPDGATPTGAAATATPAGATPTGQAPTASPTDEPSPTPVPSPAGEVVFANWPEYIDLDEETGGHPTLELFTERTGIDVRYQQDIADNAEFFGRIQPDLAAGNPTGFDVVVLSDWMIQRMIELGYLEELDHGLLPSFSANVQDLFGDPWYDPGHRYSVPWQGGITGIAYNPKLTGREITSFQDLLDPEFANSVGLFSEMYDTMGLALLSMGVEPGNATLEEVEAARDMLLEAANRGQFRGFYGNEYYTELANENLAISIAWSGDITQLQLYDNEDVVFVIPEEGGMFWVDNMAIPRAAQHPVDAHMLLDHFYDPEVATMLTEWIGYYSPVRGVRERVLEDAETARDEGDEEWATQLEEIARTAFPDESVFEQLHPYPRLPLDVFRQWQDLFDPLIHG